MYEITGKMTNDEDFEILFVITDENDGEQDITTFDFEFVLNDGDGCQLLTEASSGVTVTKDIPNATVSIFIDNDAFSAYDPGEYQIACRYTDSATDRTKQLFVGRLTIEEGGFS